MRIIWQLYKYSEHELCSWITESHKIYHNVLLSYVTVENKMSWTYGCMNLLGMAATSQIRTKNFHSRQFHESIFIP